MKRLGTGALALGLCLSVGMSMGAEAAKKGKKKGGNTAAPVTVTNASARLIPDALAGSATTPATWGKLATPLNFGGKALKGAKVGDVRVTVQTTGLTATAANDLLFRLTAPNGRTVGLGGGYTGQSIGPLTLTANSPVGICTGSAAPPPPPCDDPDETLNPPYFGTAGDTGLSFFEGVAMRGTWTLSVYDIDNLDTSTLNRVEVTVAPQPPAATTTAKKKK